VDKKVVSLHKKEEGFFEATDDSGTIYQGKKVILATGSEDIYPKIPGYEALWGDLM
jgi:thioredoxin reductase